MASLDQNIVLFKNRYMVIRFTISGYDGNVGDAHTIKWSISSAVTGGTIYLTKNKANMTISDPNIDIVIGNNDLITPTDISPGTYYHELLIIPTSGGNQIQAAVGTVDIRGVINAS